MGEIMLGYWGTPEGDGKEKEKEKESGKGEPLV